MKVILLYMPLLCLSVSVTANAQEKLDSGVNFTLKSSDNNIPDSIKILYLEDNVSFLAKRSSITLKKSNNLFQGRVPVSNPLTRISILFYYSSGNSSSNFCYIEPTDSIYIAFKKESDKALLDFSGQGSEKFRLRELLALEEQKLYKRCGELGKLTKVPSKLRLGLASTLDLNNYLDSICSFLAVSKTKRLSIVNSFKGKIDSDVLKFFTYEFVAGNDIVLLTEAYFNAISAEQKKLISNYYFAKNLNSFERSFESHFLIRYSSLYIYNRSINKFREEFMINNGIDFSFQDRYIKLKLISNLNLRDRLITEFFLTPVKLQQHISDFSKRDSCLKDAINLIKDPILHSALTYQLLFSPGSKVYSFRFQDANGQFVRLEDLKGSVFLIKFYGTGCAGCASFSKRFKNEILPQFANNLDFKIVSVSIDLSKQIWNNSIAGGLYTSDRDINLTAGKESIQNDMFKYYNVNAIPFILLVDKEGKLIHKIDNGMSSNSIIYEIKKSLKSKTALKNSK